MSYLDNFNEWKDQIENFPLKDVKLPNQPIDDFVAGVETLAVDASEDRKALAGAGLDVAIIDQLNPLSGALRYCEAQWKSVFRAQQEAQAQWKEQSPEAFDLRNELLHDFGFAYRNTDDVRKKVARIREGGSNADMVQDLIELAVLGEKYPKQLAEIKFNVEALARARALSHSMSELLAAANGAAGEGGETKDLRDKAYTLLAQKESTVREYGRYVFWKDDEKRSRYIL